jgi:glycosyltransferase involved in cell wall biosynthesis
LLILILVPTPRVLIIAENCNPLWTSVPLVGWSHYRALRERVDVHLVTQIRNRTALLGAGLREGDDFTAIDSEKVAGPAHRIGEKLRGGAGRGWTTKMFFNLFGRKYFERLLWQRFGADIDAKQFDVVHQITPLSPTLPAQIATRCRRAGVPFVWGPINGGLPWPPGYSAALAAEREWLSKLRALHRFTPGYRATRRDAAAIVVGSRFTLSQMPETYRDKCFYCPENAVDDRWINVARQRVAGKPLRAVFLGRLVAYKGPDLLLRAADELLRAGTLELDFIGNGPIRESLESTVRDRAMPGVRFLGEIGHDRLPITLAGYDVLTFPSIREFGGAVALEAMAVGTVPIVPDYGGLAELVDDATGYRVPMGGPDVLVERYRLLLRQIVNDPAPLVRKSTAGVDRVARHFTWRAKANYTCSIYDFVLKRGPKPQDFSS